MPTWRQTAECMAPLHLPITHDNERSSGLLRVDSTDCAIHELVYETGTSTCTEKKDVYCRSPSPSRQRYKDERGVL